MIKPDIEGMDWRNNYICNGEMDNIDDIIQLLKVRKEIIEIQWLLTKCCKTSAVVNFFINDEQDGRIVV